MSAFIKLPSFLTVSALAAVTIILALAGGRPLAPVLRAQAPASIWEGVYADAQAQRGTTVYKERCATCHGDKLDGGVAPALAGEDFMADWEGRSVGDLFQRTQLTMPADDPGKLTPKETVDVLAYIFSVNKFPAGQNELPSVRDTLKLIRILAKK